MYLFRYTYESDNCDKNKKIGVLLEYGIFNLNYRVMICYIFGVFYIYLQNSFHYQSIENFQVEFYMLELWYNVDVLISIIIV